jgi:DNA-binding MarR family transcriptional regulator
VAQKKLNLPDYLPYLVNRVGAALVERFTAEALARHGLTIAMWRVLVALSDTGALRQVDLAGLTSIDVSTLSRLVSRLVQMGLVTRARSARSNREVVVRLTAQADSLVGTLIPIARALERRAIAGLPKGELAAAKSALRRIYANLRGGEKRRAP